MVSFRWSVFTTRSSRSLCEPAGLGQPAVTGALKGSDLAGLENLEILSLNKTKITDSGLKNLVGLSDLKTLSLSKTKVTDMRQ